MKVALCFWGLTRSLRYTYWSIKKHILDVLEKNEIEYKIFMHTYKVNSLYTNKRAKEINIKLNNNEYKILKPDYIKIDNQNKIKKELKLRQYRRHRDPWKTKYQTVDNFILSMYSKKRLWETIEESGEEITHYVFLRPDVKYLNNLNIDWLNNLEENEIKIPIFHQGNAKFNDRFAICKPKIAEIYSTMFKYMLMYSLNRPLHSETFNRVTLMYKCKDIKINSINFFFNRIRANGFERNDFTGYLRRRNKNSSII